MSSGRPALTGSGPSDDMAAEIKRSGMPLSDFPELAGMLALSFALAITDAHARVASCIIGISHGQLLSSDWEAPASLAH